MKKKIMPVVVLTVICIVIGGLLAVVNMFTGPVIEWMENQKVTASLREVLPGEYNAEPDPMPEGAPSTVTAVYTELGGAGHVVTLEKQGYASVIGITVGVSSDGTVTGIVITKEAESHGKAGMKTWHNTLVGLNADEVADAELFTGATISSTAIRSAVYDAMVVLGHTEAKEETESALPKTDAEILALARELAPDAEDISHVLPKNSVVKRLYKDSLGRGLVAYTVTSTEYVAVETEGIIHISEDGKIVSLELLTWTVGHGVNYTDAFVNSFIGKDATELEDVELVTEATGTAVHFRDAVAEAGEIAKAQILRTDNQIATIVNEMLGGTVEYEKITLNGAPATLAKAFKVTYDGNEYYVAYTVTSTQYVAVETEAVTLIDGSTGKVVDFKILTWTVGHGVNYTEAFENSFIGKGASDIGGVDLVAEATGTSEHLRDAVAGGLELLGSNTVRSDKHLIDIAEGMLGGDVEYERIYPEGASDTLKKAFKLSCGGKVYYLAYTVTSTEYVAVETEAVTLFDGKNGKILDLEVLTWTVGHGVDYTEDFVESFIGKGAKKIEGGVELVTEATGTSVHLRDAVADAALFAPTIPYARYISIAILATAVLGFIGAMIFLRQRRKIK